MDCLCASHSNIIIKWIVFRLNIYFYFFFILLQKGVYRKSLLVSSYLIIKSKVRVRDKTRCTIMGLMLGLNMS